MSESEYNFCCFEVKFKIHKMFANFTPANVLQTRREIRSHLLVCRECREYFKARWNENKKEIAKNAN